MTLMKKVSMMAAAAALAVSLAACSSVPANTVHSMDDLPGKKIGVQLGTVGDSCASDYEGEGATVERYSKASDAVQALKQGKIDYRPAACPGVCREKQRFDDFGRPV